MSLILSQGYLNGLSKGYSRKFGNGLAAAQAAGGMLVSLVCDPENSEGFANMQYDIDTGVLLLEEITDTGMQRAQNLDSISKTVDNKEFSRLIMLHRAKLERRQAQVYNRQFTGAGKAVALTQEKLLRSRLTGGFSGTNQIFYASGSDAKKGSAKSETFYNAMTKKFSTANFDSALETLQSQSDTEKNPLGYGTSPENTILVVGPKYRKTAQKCVGATRVDGGDDNVNAGICKLVVWGQLVGDYAHHWFLFDTSVEKPGVVQNEVAPAFYMQTNPQDGTVMQTNRYMSQIYWRGNIDIINRQACYGSTGADAA